VIELLSNVFVNIYFLVENPHYKENWILEPGSRYFISNLMVREINEF
jgi:hypothetical protein